MKLASLGRILRTVSALRFVQVAAQIRHAVARGTRRRTRLGVTPQRGVEAVEVPFLPAPAHASYDGVLGFELIHRAHRFRDEVDWDYLGEGPLWAFHLHQFDYARAATLSAQARWKLIDHWIEHCKDGVGWSPHPISLRILSWGKLLLTPGALDLTPDQATRMCASLSQQADALASGLEVRLQANHLLSNIVGVVFAGLLFEGNRADAWLALESNLRHEIAIQVQPDGSHIEGSPMYHCLLLENLLDLLNLARAAKARAPEPLLASLTDAVARMLGANRVWTHPDGEIALLGDAAFHIAHPPEVLEAYAQSLEIDPVGPVERGALANAGVYRMESGELVLIATASAPSPTYQPGHAHCDALSFELSVGGERVVTDTGVSEYIPGALREISRETASHATLRIDDVEQSEIWSAHRVGGRCRVRVGSATAQRLDAQCVSWSRSRTQHHRCFRLDGGCLTIEDRIEGQQVPVRFALPLAPGLEPKLRAPGAVGRVAGRQGGLPTPAGEGAQLQLVLRSGKRLCVELPAGVRWSIEQRAYFPGFGEHVERACLVGKADVFRAGTWRFFVSRGRRRGRSQVAS